VTCKSGVLILGLLFMNFQPLYGETMCDVILRTEQVCQRLGISDTTLWRWRRANCFPEPRSVPGSSIKGWASSTVDEWIQKNFIDNQVD